MEGLASPLRLCRDVRVGIESGDAVIKIIRALISEPNSPLRGELVQLLLAFEKGQRPIYPRKLSTERKVLMDLLFSGLSGMPIAHALRSLEQEIQLSCDRQIEEHIARLPVRLLFPLIFLLLPAILLLVMGPILVGIVEGVK